MSDINGLPKKALPHKKVFTTAGTYQFSIPFNVSLIHVRGCGGGGGGGGSGGGSTGTSGGGGGGGGAPISSEWLVVPEGQQLYITLGAGGTAGAYGISGGSNGGNGSVTSVADQYGNTLVAWQGGGGGFGCTSLGRAPGGVPIGCGGTYPTVSNTDILLLINENYGGAGGAGGWCAGSLNGGVGLAASTSFGGMGGGVQTSSSPSVQTGGGGGGGGIWWGNRNTDAAAGGDGYLEITYWELY